MNLVKAHAYGNDFLLLDSAEAVGHADLARLARTLCERHQGIGADGLIVYAARDNGATMRLFNADGSHSEISGNGIRCLAAWLASRRAMTAGMHVDVATEAGTKPLELLARDGARFTFRAAMGEPERIETARLLVGVNEIDVITMRVGNPQCVVLGEASETRLRTVAAPLAAHPHFPEGTNVELVSVDDRDRLRILIWERGVGPTEASGTGACASAVAAIRFAGASRDLQVASPGGTQRVEWRTDGLYLTGWAELTAEIKWSRP